MRALWTMMRLPDENSPLITLVIMSITYYKMVGMDMENLNLVVLIIMPILQYGWNGYLSCQLS